MAVPYSARPVWRHLIPRGILIALLARAITVASAAMMMTMARQGEVDASFRLNPAAAVAFAAMCGFLMLVDLGRRSELVFFANLGVDRWKVALCAALPALLLESLFALFALVA